MHRQLSVAGSVMLLFGAVLTCGTVADEPVPAPPVRPVAAATEGPAGEDLLRVASAAVRGPAAAGTAGGPPDASTVALRRTVELLRDGLAKFAQTPAYSATFEKQEVVAGRLLDPQVMEMTLRHEPFGVHLNWVEGQRGRTLLYEAGANDGCMLVNPGGWRGRLTGTLRLKLDGAMATREARHPVTSLGMDQLGRKLLRYRLAELESASAVRCELSGGHEFAGRPVWKNVLVYRTPEAGGEFRKSIALIDRDWSLPVSVETFGWPDSDGLTGDALDAATRIERYAYTDVAVPPAGADCPFGARVAGFRVK